MVCQSSLRFLSINKFFQKSSRAIPIENRLRQCTVMVAKDILVLPFLLVLCCMLSLSWSTNIEEETSEGFYEETVVLKTKIGSLRGHKEVVDFKTSYYAFKGIRYAKAPSGAKRFQVNQFVCFLMCCFLISNFFIFHLATGSRGTLDGYSQCSTRRSPLSSVQYSNRPTNR